MPLLTRPAPSSRGGPGRALATALIARATPAQLALGRTGAGGVMLVRPRTLPRLLGVDTATSARLGWVVQMLGAREVALGLGTLTALRRQDQVASRTWLAAGVLCDAVDVLAVGGALARGRVSRGSGAAVAAVAATAVVLGVRALQQADDVG